MSKGGGPDKVVDFRSFGERPARGLATSLYIGSKADAKVSQTLSPKALHGGGYGTNIKRL